MTKSSKVDTALVLRAQPDKGEVVAHIAKLLQRMAMLWQIPNFTAQNAVILAEWTFDNYSCEPLELITECLTNPPIEQMEEKTWRLTPDTITKWMWPFLEKQAMKLEKDNQANKETFKKELPEINYESFKKRIAEGTALQDTRKNNRWTQDPEYQKLKADRYREKMQQMQSAGQVPKENSEKEIKNNG